MGYFNGTTTIGGVTLFSNSQQSNSKAIFLAKYNSSDSFQWVKKIAEGDSIYYSPFTIDHSQNIIITITFANQIYFNQDSIMSFGRRDGLVLKYDSNSIFKNSNHIGGINDDELSKNKASIDSNNSYYVSGYFNGSWSNNSPGYSLAFGQDTLSGSTMDMFIVKYDSLGNTVWAKSYGGLGEDYIFDLQWFQNKIYFIGGLYNPTQTNDIGGLNVNFPANYSSKAIIVKLDSLGNAIWIKRFGAEYFSMGATSIEVMRNRVFITGHAFSNNQNVFLFDGGPTLTGTDHRDYFIAAYDTNGTFKWNTISQSAGSESLSQLKTDSMCNVYGIGSCNYTIRFPSDTLYSYGGDDVMVCSYDSNGVYRWAFNAGGSSTDIGSAIAADANGVLYIAGGTTSTECYMGNDTLYPPSGQSTFFYARLDSIPIIAPLGVSHTSKETQGISIYPNPTQDNIGITFSTATSVRTFIELYNTLGQRVSTTEVPIGTLQLALDLRIIGNGIYYIKYQNGKNVLSQKIIVQH
jgi:hypothetical protein